MEERVINPRLTLEEGAILPWAGHPYYARVLEVMCERQKIPMNVSYGDLKKAQREKILHGTPGEHYEVIPDVKYREEGKIYRTKYEGVITTLTRRYRETDPSDPFMKRISQYVTEVTCPACDGYRLKQEYLHVIIGGLHIGQLSDLCVRDALVFMK